MLSFLCKPKVYSILLKTAEFRNLKLLLFRIILLSTNFEVFTQTQFNMLWRPHLTIEIHYSTLYRRYAVLRKKTTEELLILNRDIKILVIINYFAVKSSCPKIVKRASSIFAAHFFHSINFLHMLIIYFTTIAYLWSDKKCQNNLMIK